MYSIMLDNSDDSRAVLTTFSGMWYHIFISALVSSVLVHFIAALIALGMLWKHKLGRFTAVIIFIFGILAPITGGVITSAAIAGVYKASRLDMLKDYALIWGTGQTFLAAVMSFTRILATL